MGRRLAAGNRPVAVTGRSERGLMGRDLHLGYADRTGVWASLVGIQRLHKLQDGERGGP